MRTENTSLGLDKVYRGEALGLISTIILILSTLALGIVGIGAASADTGVTLTEDVEAALGISFLVVVLFIFAGLILALIGFIKQLKGFKQIGIDNSTFKTAFWFTIFCVVLTFSANIFGEKVPFLATISDDLTSFLDVAVAYYVVKGCIELFKDTPLEKSGRSLMKWVFALGIARVLCNCLSGMKGGMVLIFGALELVITVIFYIFYLNYLSKAKDA